MFSVSSSGASFFSSEHISPTMYLWLTCFFFLLFGYWQDFVFISDNTPKNVSETRLVPFPFVEAFAESYLC